MIADNKIARDNSVAVQYSIQGTACSRMFLRTTVGGVVLSGLWALAPCKPAWHLRGVSKPSLSLFIQVIHNSPSRAA